MQVFICISLKLFLRRPGLEGVGDLRRGGRQFSAISSLAKKRDLYYNICTCLRPRGRGKREEACI